MQARPSPRRPLVSWIDDGGSMPVPDGRMRGIRSIRERDFLLGRVRSWPESTVCSHQSAGLPSPSNRRTRRLSMLSILPISNAARWRWRHRLAEEGGEADERRAAMRAANPAFIPRNHPVEEAISAAVNDGNFLPFESFAYGALHALRGSTGLRPLPRSAATQSNRAPNVLRHLTKQGQARRRHLTTTSARQTVSTINRSLRAAPITASSTLPFYFRSIPEW